MGLFPSVVNSGATASAQDVPSPPATIEPSVIKIDFITSPLSSSLLYPTTPVLDGYAYIAFQSIGALVVASSLNVENPPDQKPKGGRTRG